MAVTPLMEQYNALKERAPDCVLFFRLGDFYEMFNEDAKQVSRELNLTLTTRDRSKPEAEQTPMCGVPYHAAEDYIGRLVKKGYKVAIVEQLAPPGKGLVERDIVRIITPGTVMENSMLTDTANNYFGSVYAEEGQCGAAFCDISTGEFYATICENVAELCNEVARFEPKELLMGGSLRKNEQLLQLLENQLNCAPDYAEHEMFDPELCSATLQAQFGKPLAELGVGERSVVAVAAGSLLARLTQRQRGALPHIRSFQLMNNQEYLELDTTARRNLELTETLRGKEKRGSLLWVIDKTGTAMGGRMLRNWVEKPLLSVKKIQNRLNAVEELTKNHMVRDEIHTLMRATTDLERIMARIVTGSASPRDLQALSEGLAQLPLVRSNLEKMQSPLLRELYEGIDELQDMRALVDAAVDDKPAVNIRDGGVIRTGYHEELDRLRKLVTGGQDLMTQIEAREKEATGIKNLRVVYSRVFGYCIEISKGQTGMAPSHYVRKQTLTNSERYVTEELSQLEAEILGAKDQALSLEGTLYRELLQTLARSAGQVQENARCIAVLDCLCALAVVAVDNHYCRPEVDTSGDIEIVDGRHPVVEMTMKTVLFVPNSTSLSVRGNRTAIITGPNMAGKSTYMRQTALIVLLAQMGSFVPAKAARIGLVDKLFTRIGASDDLASGQSTFMVEMTEMANILNNATPNSLLILDEIGRGTSTFDGMAIARAVLEFVTNRKRLGARTLFATHYHELADAAAEMDGAKNYNVAVHKRGKQIVFLRRIVAGAADNSFGVDVARLAGLPEAVIRRGHEILEQLEKGSVRTAPAAAPAPEQISMVDMQGSEICRRLAELNVEAMTPIEAMNELYRLKQLLPKD